MTRSSRTKRSGQRVDYDQIASSYNRRYASNDMAPIAALLQGLAREIDAERVLEVGCGTGRWLGDLDLVERQLCGLDLSMGMLQEARSRGNRLHLVRGKASQPPLPDAAFDMVFCVNAIHHFDDPRSFVSEGRRLLKPNGVLVVIGSDPHDSHRNWYVYDFFRGTLETDLERFPSWGTLLDWMVSVGFEEVEWRLAQQILDHKVGRDVLDDPFLQKHACSQLALLSDEAYAAGLRRIEAALDAAAAAGETVRFPVDIRIGALLGRCTSDDHRVRT